MSASEAARRAANERDLGARRFFLSETRRGAQQRVVCRPHRHAADDDRAAHRTDVAGARERACCRATWLGVERGVLQVLTDNAISGTLPNLTALSNLNTLALHKNKVRRARALDAGAAQRRNR